jgi:hypothetical protein
MRALVPWLGHLALNEDGGRGPRLSGMVKPNKRLTSMWYVHYRPLHPL